MARFRGFRALKEAGQSYAGATDLTRDINKLMFNGGEITRAITVIKAGFISVCYCARPVLDNPGARDLAPFCAPRSHFAPILDEEYISFLYILMSSMIFPYIFLQK